MPASSYRYRPSLTDRLMAIGLALAICALIILMLIRMGLLDPGPGDRAGNLTSVTFRPQAAERTERRPAVRTVQKSQRQAVVQPRETPPVQPRPVPVMPVPWIQLSREQFAASDISTIPSPPAKASSDDGGAGGAGAAAQGPGEGPGGARLYNAQWYREPTDAELVTYLPRGDVAGGWAMIACKTQERYRVEDCRELGESPRGSGLARALRLASWQFLVRPPRLDGKPMIGAWVRIRFDFTRAKADAAPDGAGG